MHPVCENVLATWYKFGEVVLSIAYLPWHASIPMASHLLSKYDRTQGKEEDARHSFGRSDRYDLIQCAGFAVALHFTSWDARFIAGSSEAPPVLSALSTFRSTIL